MTMTAALEQSEPGLQRRLNQAIEATSLNERSRQIYLHWISRFMLFQGLKAPEELSSRDAWDFLVELEGRLGVSRARLNQACSALTFFYENLLQQSNPWQTANAESA